jgi:hypothetical protein
MDMSPEDRRKALFEGHRRNPLTTRPQGGRLLSAIMLPWFGLLPPAGFGVITTTGRKTASGAASACAPCVGATGSSSSPSPALKPPG